MLKIEWLVRRNMLVIRIAKRVGKNVNFWANWNSSFITSAVSSSLVYLSSVFKPVKRKLLDLTMSIIFVILSKYHSYRILKIILNYTFFFFPQSFKEFSKNLPDLVGISQTEIETVNVQGYVLPKVKFTLHTLIRKSKDLFCSLWIRNPV